MSGLESHLSRRQTSFYHEEERQSTNHLSHWRQKIPKNSLQFLAGGDEDEDDYVDNDEKKTNVIVTILLCTLTNFSVHK